MYLGRVIGRVVASHQYEGLEGVALQIVQPLDEEGKNMGDPLVACTSVSSGPGDLVHYVDGREAALACPNTFVPVDATILGFVEEAVNGDRIIAPPHIEILPLGAAQKQGATKGIAD
ncbi:MAG: ethanolamine utilization protein EutN, partial [Planctomycetota bacterium]